MPSFLALSAAFILFAMFFSVAFVDWPQASIQRQQNFNSRDLLWAGIVACSIAWPMAMMYAFPFWMAAVATTAMCVLITYELLWPITELRESKLFQTVPRTAWLVLGFFSVLSTWITLLYIWTEEAQGRYTPGLIPNFFG